MRTDSFLNASRSLKLQVFKIKPCVMIAVLVLFRNVIYEWMKVTDFWEGKLKNRAILLGLKQGTFPVCP